MLSQSISFSGIAKHKYTVCPYFIKISKLKFKCYFVFINE